MVAQVDAKKELEKITEDTQKQEPDDDSSGSSTVGIVVGVLAAVSTDGFKTGSFTQRMVKMIDAGNVSLGKHVNALTVRRFIFVVHSFFCSLSLFLCHSLSLSFFLSLFSLSFSPIAARCLLQQHSSTRVTSFLLVFILSASSLCGFCSAITATKVSPLQSVLVRHSKAPNINRCQSFVCADFPFDWCYRRCCPLQETYRPWRQPTNKPNKHGYVQTRVTYNWEPRLFDIHNQSDL